MNKEITGSTGLGGVSGSSGVGGMNWTEVIDGITHYFSETYINGKTTNKTDRVEYNGNRILFSEYIALTREEKINEILKD